MNRGDAAEALAAQFLRSRGLTIIERNYRCRGGEIDLIARDGSSLVFVEVRLRRTGHTAEPPRASPQPSGADSDSRRSIISDASVASRHAVSMRSCSTRSRPSASNGCATSTQPERLMAGEKLLQCRAERWIRRTAYARISMPALS